MQYEKQSRQLILQAADRARSMGHSYVGSAHLLLALSDAEGAAGQMLRFAGFFPDRALLVIRGLYGTGTPGLPLPQGFSRQMRRILRRAGEEATQFGSRWVTAEHMLLALLRAEESSACQVLLFAGIDPHLLFTAAVEQLQQGKPGGGNRKEAVDTKLLEQFSEDMIAKAVECK